MLDTVIEEFWRRSELPKSNDDYIVNDDTQVGIEFAVEQLKERILQLEDLANTVAHVGVDFGYGEFQLEAQHIEQARNLVPQK